MIIYEWWGLHGREPMRMYIKQGRSGRWRFIIRQGEEFWTISSPYGWSDKYKADKMGRRYLENMGADYVRVTWE